ncbi:hypothetical protein GCM10027213_36260 [Mycobacterium bourgelatii]
MVWWLKPWAGVVGELTDMPEVPEVPEPADSGGPTDSEFICLASRLIDSDGHCFALLRPVLEQYAVSASRSHFMLKNAAALFIW